MKQIILIGEENTKRTDYFLNAAKQLQVKIRFVKQTDCVPSELEEAIVKVDPPVFHDYNIEKMEDLLHNYHMFLEELEKNQRLSFLNQPKGIWETLDKVKCKQKLQQAGISTTEMLAVNIRNQGEIEKLMKEKKAFSVFIKPIYSSGAVGILAYRYLPNKNKRVIYTSTYFDEGHLINTKALYRIENDREIAKLMEEVLSMDTIVERWYPKEEYKNKKYDLRVVYQFGKIDFMVVRQSNGPITNLHLNNQALPIEDLSLSKEKKKEIEELCCQAMELYPNMNSIGFDILLEKNTKKPYIIEMNGQGDLLYLDIFHENIIYKDQIQYMKNIAIGK